MEESQQMTYVELVNFLADTGIFVTLDGLFPTVNSHPHGD